MERALCILPAPKQVKEERPGKTRKDEEERGKTEGGGVRRSQSEEVNASVSAWFWRILSIPSHDHLCAPLSMLTAVSECATQRAHACVGQLRLLDSNR